MRVFKSVQEWLAFRDSRDLAGKSLGFVPTMGALHEGHASLVRKSAEECELTLVSIFVNPTQFDDPSDLEKYPRTFESDVTLLEKNGADFLLYPEAKELYADQYRYRVQENELSRILCGAHRPGHFDGVLTIVLKLLNIAGAEKAFFGEKDYQQLQLVKGMAEAFFMKTEIIGCPTLREKDGLAMSSRNTRLSKDEREKATAFARELASTASPETIRMNLIQAGFEVDYIEECMGRRLGAVRLGAVRLIDNVPKP